MNNLLENANRYMAEQDDGIDKIYTGQKSRHEVLTKPRFDLDKIGQREANDQEGPGFYFTTNPQEALGYAHPNGIVVTAKFTGNNLISVNDEINDEHVDKMIEMSPDLDDTLANWGYDPGYSSREDALAQLKDAIYSDENAKDIWLTVWYELYRDEPRQFVENMVKLGYDGLIVTPRFSDDPNRKHVVIYNINAVNVEDVQQYKDLTSDEETQEEGINMKPEDVFVNRANQWLYEEEKPEYYYVKWSSHFDNPDNKYDLNLFGNTLKKAGAHINVENQFGWSNQPEVIVFSGISVEDAEEVLNKLPVFKDQGVIIHDVDWEFDKGEL